MDGGKLCCAVKFPPDNYKAEIYERQASNIFMCGIINIIGTFHSHETSLCMFNDHLHATLPLRDTLSGLLTEL